MPQLLVRDIELSVVKRLRSSAAAQGISVEEAHRRLLRSVLMGHTPDPKDNFVDYLRSIPTADDIEFPRSPELPRSTEL